MTIDTKENDAHRLLGSTVPFQLSVGCGMRFTNQTVCFCQFTKTCMDKRLEREKERR